MDDTIDSGIRESAPSLNREGGGFDIGERVTRLETRWEFLATREDLAKVEAKLEAGLANCATREDLAKLEAKLEAGLANCATREDLAKLEVRLEAKLEAGLANCATREDLESAISKQTRWMIVTMIALAGTMVAIVAAAVGAAVHFLA